MKQRVELHLHTTMSDDPSVITPNEVILSAWDMGHTAVAITDLNSVQSFAEVARYQKKYANNIKVIYGAEVAYRKDGAIGRAALLAQNADGLRELYRIISSLRDQAVDWQIIESNRANLLVGGLSWTGEVENVTLYDYIAITPTTRQEEQCQQWHLYTRAKEINIPVVAVGNCHYLDGEDQICKEILDKIREVSQEEESTPYRNTEKMLEAMAYLGEDVAWEVVVTTPNKLADSVQWIDPVGWEYPAFSLPKAYETVCSLCEEKLKTLYGQHPPAGIRNRLDTELALVKPHVSMYLLAHLLVRHLQEKGAVTGFRGTIGSTLIAHLLHISDMNPLPAHYRCPACKYIEFAPAVSGYDLPEKTCPYCGAPMRGDGHNIPFETCMGIDGELAPDIDINGPKALQREAKWFITELLGENRVVLAGIVSTLNQRLTSCYVQNYLEQCGEEDSPEVVKRITDRLIGVKKHDGVMPWGLVLLPEGMEWEDITPTRSVENAVSGLDKATHIDYYAVDHALPKLDVLSYGVLDRVQKLFAVTGTKPEDIDYHDPKVFALFESLDTCGIPEFSSDFTKGLLSRVGDLCFSNLVRVSGIAHGTMVWCGNGEHLWEEHSFGELIGDRDDVFLTLRKYGIDQQTAYTIMTTVRKGRFGTDTPRNQQLTEILEQAGVPDWYIASMKKICYLFPKAHAAHYTKLALTLAWFKVYYPAQFYDVTLDEMGAEEFDRESNDDLLRRLTYVEGEDHCVHGRVEMLALLLEARCRGFR